MLAKNYTCLILQKVWLSPTVMGIRFEPQKNFRFKPGQFLSVIVPDPLNKKHFVKRAFSFANSYERAIEDGYEICMKFIPGGFASIYMDALREGTYFKISAPYGHFTYHTPERGRSVCFISTGTGIAPFRSILLSSQFLEDPPERAFSIFGARTEDEILYPGLFQSLGIQSEIALSKPNQKWSGYTGRVTNYLSSLPSETPWHTTDFYLCGGAAMVNDVRQILMGAHGVKESAIYSETFSSPPYLVKAA